MRTAGIWLPDRLAGGTELTSEQLNLSVDGVSLTVATVRRYSDLAIIFLQGLGSTKDYPDAAQEPAFAGRPFLAYDAPGCGETSHEDLPGIFIPFLVKTAQTVLQDTGIQRSALSAFHGWPGACGWPPYGRGSAGSAR